MTIENSGPLNVVLLWFRTFRLVLTDVPQVEFGSETYQVNPKFDALTFAPIFPVEGVPHQDLALVVRVDRLVLQKNGNYREDALLQIVCALLVEIYGYWQETISTPLQDRPVRTHK